MRNAKSTKKKGAVLVVVLWILIILVLLAISIGRRTFIELRLLRYHLDRTQAFYLARAGLERIYHEKAKEKEETETAIDTLDEPWSNKLNSGQEPEFKDFALGNGKFEVKYDYLKTKENKTTFYGMQDELSKFNINKIIDAAGKVIDARAGEFKKLLKNILKDSSVDVDELADKCIDWIDSDTERPNGREEYDQGIEPKNAPLNRLEELTMIDGFSAKIVAQIGNYLTVYGDGFVNVNTAPQEVLEAIGFVDENSLTAQDIIKCRNEGIYIKEIKEGCAYFSDGAPCVELGTDIDGSRLTVASTVFMAHSYGKVNAVTKKITTVVTIKSNESLHYLYWHED